jgi:hypothetical protein
MAGYEELSALAAAAYREDGDADSPDLGECDRCGSTTSRDVCRKCRLLDSIEAAS